MNKNVIFMNKTMPLATVIAYGWVMGNKELHIGVT